MAQSLPASLSPYAARAPSELTEKLVSERVPSLDRVFGSTSTRPPARSSSSESATNQTSWFWVPSLRVTT